MKTKVLLFALKGKTLFVLCAAFVLISGIQGMAQESEIESLVKEVSIDSQKGAIFNYSYFMKFSYHHYKFGGRKFTRLYEAIIPSRFTLNRTFSHPFVLLEDSERNIPAEEIKIARLSIAKEIERAEAEVDKQSAIAEKPNEDGGYWTIGFSNGTHRVKVDILQLLKNSRLSNLQRKPVNGVNVVLIDFAPNPEAVFEKSLSYFSKMEGQIWIDETAKRIIRVEGYAPGTFAAQREKPDIERQTEAVFLFLQSKVPEGFWFPQTVWLNFAKHPEIFESVKLEFAFSNYKKWGVNIEYQESKSKEGETITQQP
jgi:hypothetical protein